MTFHSSGSVLGPLLLPPIPMSQRLTVSQARALSQSASQPSHSSTTPSDMDFTRRQLAGLSKPEITISLDTPQPAFSTFDRITGQVTITVKHPTPFSAVEISLTGITKTFISDPSRGGASMKGSETEAVHRFLKLVQPVDISADLPADQILRPGTIYCLAFVFVVPPQLLPRVCAHAASSSTVRDAHLQLPPSLGDRIEKADDFASKDVKISYSIHAKLQKDKSDGKKTTFAETSRKVRILPATEEYPPLDTEESKEYCMRKTKTIRKGLFKGKLGTLVMEASQPSRFQLPPAGSTDESSSSTYLRLHFRFDPASPASNPPKLSSLSTKLKVATYYATTTRSDFARPPQHSWQDMTSDCTTETLSLSTIAMGSNIHWTVHKPQAVRAVSALSTASVESGTSTESTVEASENYKDGLFYTSTIIVPMNLPSSKKYTFVPTFHSCLVSRTYALHVALGIEKGSMCVSPLALKVPVQVSSAQTEAGQERQRAEMLAEQAARDADLAFEPRMLSSASPQLRRTTTMESTMELPPGYEVINNAGFTLMRSSTMMT